MKITYRQLEKLEVYPDLLALFRDQSGEEVELTESIVVEHWPDFDLDWAAHNLFPAVALDQYQKVTATLSNKYEKATALAWAEYEKAAAAAWAEHEKASATIFWRIAQTLD